MTEEQLIPIIENYINHSIQGLDKENPKLDFKRKWLDLTEKHEINEFLKDTTSIANTVGLDGFIIIGFDEKTSKYYPAKFSDCNLRDSNELNGLIIKRVDRLFQISNYNIEIDNNQLSILHIPPSFDKPHVIRNYIYKNDKEEVHRIWVRHGTTTRIATKYDIDFMNYDKKKLIPEYLIYMSSSLIGYIARLHQSNTNESKIELTLNLNFENAGHRPVAINKIVLELKWPDDSFKFISSLNTEASSNKNIKVSNIVIQPGRINNYTSLIFLSERTFYQSGLNSFQNSIPGIQKLIATISLNTGKEITTGVEIIK